MWNSFKQGLLWLFVPPDNYFEDKIDEFKEALDEKIHYQQYLNSLHDIENITDLTGDTDEITLGIGLQNYSVFDKFTINMNKFIDFSIFTRYKATWYSWVRVVVYIGLVLYNINEVVKFFNGFSATGGSIKDIATYSSNTTEKGAGKK